MKDQISVIVPLYNGEKTIEQTLQSVIDQTYTHWDLLVIDDASSDRGPERVKAMAQKDKRIRLICLKKNGGVAQARNKGIGLATGRYLAFLDADDWWQPEKLERQLARLKDSQAGLCYTAYWRVPDQGKSKRVHVPESLDRKRLLRGNRIACSTVLLDRDQTGPFEMPDIRHEDYATWLDIANKGIAMVGLNEALTDYRVYQGSLSGNKWQSALWTWQIYRNHCRLSLSKSLIAFFYYMIQAIHKRGKYDQKRWEGA